MLPEPGWVVGYAALIDHYDLSVPAPRIIAIVSERYDPQPAEGFMVFGRRRFPAPSFSRHIELALKEEGVRLDVLNVLFRTIDPDIVAKSVREAPLGKYARRLWFLFEWLTEKRLDIPDTEGRPKAVNAVNTSQQVGIANGALSHRQQVRNNLPGTRQFCPMIWRTEAIRRHESASYDQAARRELGNTHQDLITRAAAFLLLSDSRSSFEIEGERPSPDRTRRWGQAITEAGTRDLDVEELIRLQHIVIGDARFMELGLRTEGGFVGTRDRINRDPIPEHISASPSDLEDLLRGLFAYHERAASSGVNPVHIAAAVAFGFVYIHPFQDGNGRIHRWLIHFVLSKAGYNPPGIPFPVSASILRNIDGYRTALRSYSERLLPCIEWKTTDRHNVEVLNETAHHYRFFDATSHAEFLFDCVRETAEVDLPAEVRFLESYARFELRIQQVVDMPRDTIDLLFRFLQQSDGRLSQRARKQEFSALTEDEARLVEDIYAESVEL